MSDYDGLGVPCSSPNLLVLIEGRSYRRVKTVLTPSGLAHRARDGTELTEHFGVDERLGVGNAEALERAFRKIAQQDARVGVQLIERRWRPRSRRRAPAPVSSRRFP